MTLFGKTSLSVAEVAREPEMSPADRQLKVIWDALPRDRLVPEEEAFRLVLEAADH
jgi:hypothetical protein